MWEKSRTFRRYKKTLDIVQADFDDRGVLLSINPYLDPDSNPAQDVSESVQEEINKKIIKSYNELKNLNDKRRPFALKLKIKKWILSQKNLRGRGLANDLHYVDRILSGIFIHFEQLPSSKSGSLNDRFIDPPFIKFKHRTAADTRRSSCRGQAGRCCGASGGTGEW